MRKFSIALLVLAAATFFAAPASAEVRDAGAKIRHEYSTDPRPARRVMRRSTTAAPANRTFSMEPRTAAPKAAPTPAPAVPKAPAAK